MTQTHTVTHTTSGHRDLETESAQRADTVKRRRRSSRALDQRVICMSAAQFNNSFNLRLQLWAGGFLYIKNFFQQFLFLSCFCREGLSLNITVLSISPPIIMLSKGV